jgi:hypothetical protein
LISDHIADEALGGFAGLMHVASERHVFELSDIAPSSYQPAHGATL